MVISLYVFLYRLAPSQPLHVNVSQNGPNSVEVSWTPPQPGGSAVTSYIIYCKKDGGQKFSVPARANATTTTIAGLITGHDYNITMVAMSSNLPSIETAVTNITISKGILHSNHVVRESVDSLCNDSANLPLTLTTW